MKNTTQWKSAQNQTIYGRNCKKWDSKILRDFRTRIKSKRLKVRTNQSEFLHFHFRVFFIYIFLRWFLLRYIMIHSYTNLYEKKNNCSHRTCTPVYATVFFMSVFRRVYAFFSLKAQNSFQAYLICVSLGLLAKQIQQLPIEYSMGLLLMQKNFPFFFCFLFLFRFLSLSLDWRACFFVVVLKCISYTRGWKN